MSDSGTLPGTHGAQTLRERTSLTRHLHNTLQHHRVLLTQNASYLSYFCDKVFAWSN